MYVPKRELSKSQICLLTLFKNKSLAKGFEFTVIENIHVKSLENLGYLFLLQDSYKRPLND